MELNKFHLFNFIMKKKNKYFYIIIILLLYIISLAFGFALGLHGGKQSLHVRNLTIMESFIGFAKILCRNTFAYLILFTSIFLGRIIIYFFFCLNGYLLGLVISKFKFFLDLITIVPHGIIEMGTFILTGYFLICYMQINNKKFLKYASFMYSGIIIAAFIESFITPQLAQYVLK